MTDENVADAEKDNRLHLLQKIQISLISTPIGSPCINVCKLDEFTRTYCIGCRRPREEIKAWKTMDDAQKQRILLRIAAEIDN